MSKDTDTLLDEIARKAQDMGLYKPDNIKDSDGKDDFTEGKPYIEEVHKITVKRSNI